MIRQMAEYRIKEGTLDTVQTAVKKFVAAVHHAEPETEYTPYRVGDSNQFIHVMAFVDEAAQKRHQKAEYTLQFVKVLYPNCEEMPTFTPLTVIR
jgi:quinol monooxygenase YgiN